MEKDNLKINDGLYYDERSAGGIVFKIENKKVYWLLVRTASRKRKKNEKAIYKFPKGHLKKNEFLKQAALREVEEEGKVKAKIISKLGSNNYIIWDNEERKKIIKKVTFFLMEFGEISNLKYFDSEMVIDRDWFSFEEASEKLAYESEKVLLKKAKKKLESLSKPLCR
ncbi:MAG: NUDIX domain-containing protein [Candidatus Shapirobacteria bacterium]|nr:NUDIX domain-containing protein [Candidatus Shapirobacteria bacterium]